MSRKIGYGGYALAVLLVSIGIDGILFSTGYSEPLILFSLPFIMLGLYTVFFSIYAADWKYYLIWGLLMCCLGFSLFLTILTGNLPLNLSVSLVIIVLVGVIVSRIGKH
ncbi:MAG: hypothetical protein ACP5PQ_06360 [Thermoproteota archaeon]